MKFEIFESSGGFISQNIYGIDLELRKISNKIESFYKHYPNSFWAEILNFSSKDNFLEYQFSREERISITEFLGKYPEKREEIWQQIMHLIRYLKYNNIALSDLKPEKIYVDIKNNEIKLFGIIPEKNIVNFKWSAPEQYEGKLSWLSNLYTFGLIILSDCIEPGELRDKSQTEISKKIELINSSDLKKILPKILVEFPKLRLKKISKLFLHKEIKYKPHFDKEYKYSSYLEFHKSLCDIFYSNKINYQYSFKLFEKYSLLKAPLLDSEADYLSKDFIKKRSIKTILKNENIFWTAKGVVWENNPFKFKFSGKLPITEFNESYWEWDFKKYRFFFNILEENLMELVSYPLNEISLILKNLCREAKREKAVRFLEYYYKENFRARKPSNEFLFLWKYLAFYSGKDNFLKYDKLINNNKPRELKILNQIYNLSNSRKFTELEYLLEQDLSDDLESLLLSIICRVNIQKANKYYNRLYKLALKQKNFYQIVNLTSFKKLVLETKRENEFEYSLILALMIDSPIIFFMVLFRIMDNAFKHKDFELQRKIIAIYEKEMSAPSLKSCELKSVYQQLLEYYYQNEFFDKAQDIIERKIEEMGEYSVDLFLTRYLQILTKNRIFSIDKKIGKIIKERKSSLKKKYAKEFREIALYFDKFAVQNEIDTLEIKLCRRFKYPKKHFILKVLDLKKEMKPIEFIKNIREMKAESCYIRAEIEFFSGLTYWEIDRKKISLKYFKAAQMFFNKVGLYNRTKEIEKYLKEISGAVNEKSKFEWERNLFQIRKAETKREFKDALEEIIFTWLGFDLVVPFTYQKDLKSFIPLNLQKDKQFNILEVMNYTKDFIAKYEKDNTFLEEPQNFEFRENSSIELNKIQASFCVPIEYLNEIIGIIYLKSFSKKITLTREKFTTLKFFLSSVSHYFLDFSKPKYEISNLSNFYGIIGISEQINEIKRKVKILSRINYSVLINGESGVGKEMAAKALYKDSGIKGNFVRINCPNLSKELFESQLFGHKKGAFTGASDDYIGKIEDAENGYLFFDEIGDMPLSIQAKMLRIIENKEYSALGSNKVKEVKSRFVFATNKNLEKLVESGKFRADLFARINQFRIDIPPLRMHLEDIPLLVKHFTEIFRKDNPHLELNFISESKIEEYQRREWKLNIRQLKYEVFRELMQIQNINKEVREQLFQVSFTEKLNRKELEGLYTRWLLENLNDKKEVMDILNVSAATFYRLLKQ